VNKIGFAIHELEAKRDQQRDPQQHEGADGEVVFARHADVVGDAVSCVPEPSREHRQEDDRTQDVRFFVQTRTWRMVGRQVGIHGHVRHVVPLDDRRCCLFCWGNGAPAMSEV
jgi:hypothetical protein